jgi:hypothetical protein
VEQAAAGIEAAAEDEARHGKVLKAFLEAEKSNNKNKQKEC